MTAKRSLGSILGVQVFGMVLGGVWEDFGRQKLRLYICLYNFGCSAYKYKSSKRPGVCCAWGTSIHAFGGPWGFQISFYCLFSEFVVFLNVRNLENSDFPQGKYIFLQNILFHDRSLKVPKMSQKVMDWGRRKGPKNHRSLDASTYRKSIKNWWISKSKFRKIV